MQPIRLRVRHRRTLLDADSVRVALSTFCPRRGEAVDVARCTECGYSDGVVRRSNGRASISCNATELPDWESSALDLYAAEVTPVFELMAADVLCFAPETPADLALRCLSRAGLEGAPVVDEEGRLHAYVTRDDLVRALLEEDLSLLPSELDALESRLGSSPGFHIQRAPVAVGQVQAACARAVPESASLGRAAAYMSSQGVQQLVVVSAAGEVVGVLTALDLVAWLARDCGYNVQRRKPSAAPEPA